MVAKIPSSAPKPTSGTPAPKSSPKVDKALEIAGEVKKASAQKGKKPSTTKAIAGGAAGGAATGAALGSVVPGIGTAVGAGAGAVIGGAGGAFKGHSSKKAYKDAAKGDRAGPTRILIMEFVVCMIILAFSPLTDKHKDEGPTVFMKRASAVCALFLILGLISSGGKGAAKISAAFGGIVVTSLLVSNRDIFTVLAEKFNNRGNATSAGRALDGTGIDDGIEEAEGIGINAGIRTASGTSADNAPTYKFTPTIYDIDYNGRFNSAVQTVNLGSNFRARAQGTTFVPTGDV